MTTNSSDDNRVTSLPPCGGGVAASPAVSQPGGTIIVGGEKTVPVGVKPIAPVPSGCVDTPPPDSAYTCAEQASFGKCNEDFMKDFCNASCNRCPGGASPAVVAAPPSPSPSPTGGHARSLASYGAVRAPPG